MKWVAVLLCVWLSACGAPSPRGRLVIAGGAVKADNEQIYSEFVRSLPADAVIGVVPTASASAAESAASSARTLARYAAGRQILELDFPSDKPANAFDPVKVTPIDQCSALWFTGGVQSRVLNVFRPADGDSPAFHAAKRLLDRGGTIGGTSAGAAMMSDPMITGGSSEDALLGNFRTEDEDSGLGLGRGMGFFPYGLVDQHFLRRGRIGRLIVALEQTGVSRGYGVEENSAIVADLTTHVIGVRGTAVVVDLTSATRRGRSLHEVRVSLLQTGDTVDGATGRIVLESASAAPVDSVAPPAALPEAWSSGGLVAGISALAATPRRVIALQSKGFTVHLRADRRTVFSRSEAGLSARDVALDITPREDGVISSVRFELGLSRDSP